MNPCLFQSPAGAASTFEPLRDPTARHRVSRTISLFRRAVGSLGMVLRTLVGRTRFGLCLPSPCVPIIADWDPLVKGFSIHFANFFRFYEGCPRSRSFSVRPLRDLVDQTPRHFGRIIPTLVGHCYPPFLGGGAQTPRLPTFHAIASCAGGQPIPVGIIPFRWSYYIIVGRACQHFFEISPEVRQRYRGGACLLHSDQRLAGLAVLGKIPTRRTAHIHKASPCSALCRRPSEGLGSASPPDNDIIASL